MIKIIFVHLANFEINNMEVNNHVCTINKIPEFINISTLKKYINKDLEMNREYFDDINATYKISDPKKAEWILHKSIIKSKLIGNGNTNFDIMINDALIDVCVLTLNKKSNYTNEKSVLQNFKDSANLDQLFINKNDNDALNIYKKSLIKKYDLLGTKSLYYIIFVCHNKNIFMCCLRLEPKNIKNITCNGFSKKEKSIIVNNFINNIGSTILYKSKKRMEIRLHKSIINHKYVTKLY